MTLTIDQAELVGTSLESVAFGIYLTLFPVSVYVLVVRVKDAGGKVLATKLLLLGDIALFCFVTAHWIIDQDRLWTSFITNQGKPHGAILLYAQPGDIRNVLRIVIFVLEVMTIDSLLLYRLYIIWNRNWRVCVLPAVTLVATIVTCSALCVGYARAPPYVDIWKLEVVKWIVAGFSLSISTNIIAVVLIAGRVIARNRQVASMGVRDLMPIVTIIVESAGLYCIVNLAIMIALVSRTSFHYTALAIASPVTGISFSLITIRVGLVNTLSRLAHSINSISASRGAAGPAHPMQVRLPHERHRNHPENGFSHKADSDSVGTPNDSW